VPLYEYECRKCHFRFERIQKFSDRPVRRCPKCKTGRVEKLLSSPAVHFKGTGWYVTDYGGKGGAGKGGGRSEGGSSDDGGSSKEDKSPAKDTSSKDSSSKK
jgi:putative FmdB family regulatory protein